MTIKETLLYLGKAVLFGLIMAAMFLLVTHYFDNKNLGSSLLQNRGNNTVELSFAKAVRRAAPAVVNIYSLSIDQSRPLNSGSLQGLGSGVIMRDRKSVV